MSSIIIITYYIKIMIELAYMKGCAILKKN